MESQKVYDRLLLAIVFIFVIIGIVHGLQLQFHIPADQVRHRHLLPEKQIAFAVSAS